MEIWQNLKEKNAADYDFPFPCTNKFAGANIKIQINRANLNNLIKPARKGKKRTFIRSVDIISGGQNINSSYSHLTKLLF